MYKKIILILVLFFGIIFMIYFQIRIVMGIVIDNVGEVLSGVSVFVKGILSGIVFDVKGNFSIGVFFKFSMLVFSFVGMVFKEVMVGSQFKINVMFLVDENMLEDIVVVVYGIQKKRDFMGFVVFVNIKEMFQVVFINIFQGLQGCLVGVLVQKNDGVLGGGVNIQIRGINFFLSNM